VHVQFVVGLILALLWIFLVFLFARLVVDWVQFFARGWEPKGILLVLLEGVYTVTDPPLKALRRVIPPLKLGGFALDLSFLLLIVIIYVLQALVGSLA
jgi:YggT family protein